MLGFLVLTWNVTDVQLLFRAVQIFINCKIINKFLSRMVIYLSFVVIQLVIAFTKSYPAKLPNEHSNDSNSQTDSSFNTTQIVNSIAHFMNTHLINIFLSFY